MICSYCKTDSINTVTCDFCFADLTAVRPKINELLDLSNHYSQPELQTMHTIDLLHVLKRIRADRGDMYKTMQLIRKAPQEAQKAVEGYSELKEDGIRMYQEITARKNVVEQILVDRMGYFPERIDDKLLNALKDKIRGTKSTHQDND